MAELSARWSRSGHKGDDADVPRWSSSRRSVGAGLRQPSPHGDEMAELSARWSRSGHKGDDADVPRWSSSRRSVGAGLRQPSPHGDEMAELSARWSRSGHNCCDSRIRAMPIPCGYSCYCVLCAIRAHRADNPPSVSYTHLRAHETVLDLVCRLLLEKK